MEMDNLHSIKNISILGSLKDELVLKCSSSKIQDSSLKDELVLRRSPSKFIDGHCNISWICVCCVLINASFLMTMCFFQLYTKCAPTTPCKAQLGELHIFIKLKCGDLNKFLFKWSLFKCSFTFFLMTMRVFQFYTKCAPTM